MRELGVGLDAVAEVLDEGSDRIAVLRRHRRMLMRERDRLQQLVDMIGRTIEELEGGDGMTEHLEQWFEGFDAERQHAYEAEGRCCTATTSSTRASNGCRVGRRTTLRRSRHRRAKRTSGSPP